MPRGQEKFVAACEHCTKEDDEETIAYLYKWRTEEKERKARKLQDINEKLQHPDKLLWRELKRLLEEKERMENEMAQAKERAEARRRQREAIRQQEEAERQQERERERARVTVTSQLATPTHSTTMRRVDRQSQEIRVATQNQYVAGFQADSCFRFSDQLTRSKKPQNKLRRPTPRHPERFCAASE
jgi:hypothetical protein